MDLLDHYHYLKVITYFKMKSVKYVMHRSEFEIQQEKKSTKRFLRTHTKGRFTEINS